ncbi:MAG: YafY family transcriptional regulator [Alphaproteobacteria bacterium]|nr:YafY family transcriptional regulator [Alphaproteobacteria bacterium]
MRRADRLFRIVQLLRTRGLVTAEDMAEELGVSKRTIYRDIRDLMESDVPIRGEAGVGYQLRRGFELPPLTFTSEQIEALVLGARLVEARADAQLAEAARAAMAKIEAVLPAPLRRVLLDTQLFAPHFGSPQDSDQVALLRRAISERRKVRFAYENQRGEPSARQVRPLGLYFWGQVRTLAAWCELRDDYRNFRTDRVTDLVVLDEPFDPDEGPSLEGFLAREKSRIGDARPFDGVGQQRG